MRARGLPPLAGSRCRNEIFGWIACNSGKIVPKVRIVADYCSSGYQLADPAARAHGELPVSDALLARLAAWNDRYEACDPQAYEDVGGGCFDFVAFAAEGLQIARAVKRALPQWTVTYWDEAMDWYLSRDPRGYKAGGCEYEVGLDDASGKASGNRP